MRLEYTYMIELGRGKRINNSALELVSTSGNKKRTGSRTTVREIILQWMELEFDEAVRIIYGKDQT